MSTARQRPTKHLIIEREKSRASTFRLLNFKAQTSATPIPESAFLMNNKLELLSSLKSNFQSQSRLRHLTPIESSSIKSPEINLASLNIRNYGLGDQRAKMLSGNLRAMSNLKKLNLKGNNMHEAATVSIIDSINQKNLKVLDVSSNKIGILGLESISDLLSRNDCTLIYLNIENIKISLQGLNFLSTALKQNTSLKWLNLANNRIGLGCGKILSEMLQSNSTLETLDLQWNFVRGIDAVHLSSAISNNSCLKVLDLSWNAMGQDKVNNSILSICLGLFSNKTLEHLDLSNNNFSVSDCKVIEDCVKVNQTIKGLHVEGNYGEVDALGFVFVRQSAVCSNKAAVPRISAKNLQRCEELCWVCNTWSDIKIEWDPSRVVWNRRLKHFALGKLETQREPIYIHLEIDNFEPFLLTQSEFGVYECVRALPRGKLRFFFTYRGIAQISNEYPVEVTEPPVEKFVHFYANFSKKIMAVILNVIYNTNSENIVLPRVPREEYKLPPGDMPEPNIPPWLFENSIFAPSAQDPEIFNKCFEADWANSKFTKFLKAESIRFICKEILRNEYKKIFYTYKYLAGLNINSSFHSVSLNSLTELYQKKGVIDKVFKLSDLDLNIKACTSSSSSVQFNSAFSVVRHEFLELQARIGIDKYFRFGSAKSEPEALSTFFSLNLYTDLDPNEWRIKRYFNEECDTILTNNKEMLTNAFEQTKGKYSNCIDRKLMIEEDFVMMLQEHGFFNEKLTIRYGYLCFRMALMVRVDELTNSGFMQMGFVEFLEALSRVIDIYDSQDPERDIMLGYCNGEVMLDKKLENMLTVFNYLKVRRSRVR